MRKVLLVSLVLVAACSKPQNQADSERNALPPPPPASKFDLPIEPDDTRSENRSTVANGAAPGVSITAAPGVAFNYRYAFRLPDAKIAAVQEQHAMACEKLGIDRCRIVGMRYRLSDHDDVSAMLAFKLDPAIAREFGKQGIAIVTAAAGTLVDSEISGTDAGATIAQADRRTTQLRETLATIEAQLKTLGSQSSDRVELQQQADSLRQQLRGTADTKTEARASLATTPMVFDYGSGNLVPGFGGSLSLRDAFGTAIGSFLTMLSFIVIAFGTLLPWALLGGLGFFMFRSIHRWLPNVRMKANTETTELSTK